MKLHGRMNLFVLMIVMLSLTACSYTRITTSWRADDFQKGQIKKTMVMAIVEKKIIRWKIEDEFVLNLRKMGVDAVQSYKSLPELKGVDVNRVKTVVAETGHDSILVVRLLDTRKETAVVPATTTTTGGLGGGWGNSFGTYYSGSSTTIYSPGYTFDYKVFTVQGNLYVAGDEKLVWTVVAEIEEPPDSVDAALKEFANIITGDLKKKDLF